jgi:hypothetical protein
MPQSFEGITPSCVESEAIPYELFVRSAHFLRTIVINLATSDKDTFYSYRELNQEQLA